MTTEVYTVMEKYPNHWFSVDDLAEILVDMDKTDIDCSLKELARYKVVNRKYQEGVKKPRSRKKPPTIPKYAIRC